MQANAASLILSKKIELFHNFSSAFYDCFLVEKNIGDQWFLIHSIVSLSEKRMISIRMIRNSMVGNMAVSSAKSQKTNFDKNFNRRFVGNLRHLQEGPNRSFLTFLDGNASHVIKKNDEYIGLSKQANLTESFRRSVCEYAYRILMQTAGSEAALALYLNYKISAKVVTAYFNSVILIFRPIWVKFVNNLIQLAAPDVLESDPDAASCYNSAEWYMLIFLFLKSHLAGEPFQTEEQLRLRLGRIRHVKPNDTDAILEVLRRYRFFYHSHKIGLLIGSKFIDIINSFMQEYDSFIDSLKNEIMNIAIVAEH